MGFASLVVTMTLVCSAGVLRLVFAADGGFKDNCNVWSAQLEGHDLGMYCENDNTAMYGYNWTWYATSFPPQLATSTRLSPWQHRVADGCVP